MPMPKHSLLQEALNQHEGILCDNGALAVATGQRTGRSPKDRFIVCDEHTQHNVEWNAINQPFTQERFDLLWDKTEQYLKAQSAYEGFFLAGQHPNYPLYIHASTEFAWHMLFLSQLFLGLDAPPASSTPWRLYVAPKLLLNPDVDFSHSDGIVVLNFSQKKILIVGMRYSGEIKKSIFAVMNYLLPEQQVLSMHCAANAGADGEVSLFFGLSGTGKTTLSADPKRRLIGDDEHGWSEDGIFNIEQGCYAKCFGLSADSEPLIFDAIRDQTILENVVISEEGKPDYHNPALSLNARAAYPLSYVAASASESVHPHPSCIFMLSCDLYGVLPSIAKLTADQALFWFLLGYTTHMGSTEYGESGIRPTFSTCFGAPFFPRNPEIYANLLKKNIEKHQPDVFLINTGYYGGDFTSNTGRRYPLAVTREIIDSVLSKRIHHAAFEEGPFGLMIPQLALSSFPVFNPMKLWSEPELYMKNKNILEEHMLNTLKKLPISQLLKERLLQQGMASSHSL